MADACEHMGQRISIAGFSGVGLTGGRRHGKDTAEVLCLTVYAQDGALVELVVKHSRDMEMFQEWLRRFDRYTPDRNRHGEKPQALSAKHESGLPRKGSSE